MLSLAGSKIPFLLSVFGGAHGMPSSGKFALVFEHFQAKFVMGKESYNQSRIDKRFCIIFPP